MKGLGATFAALGLVACALVIACAEARAPTAAPQTMVTSPDPHAQIRELAQAIDSDRTRLGLDGPTVDRMTAPPPTMPTMAPSARTCAPAPSQACQDTCHLDDSICSNATKICQLADQLPGDDWAAKQCTNAKATCDASHAKCCACS